jgi:hypothetical protein
MELIKKTMDVRDAKGWYLTRNEKRCWTEEFVDEDSGENERVERSEIICGRGSQLNELLISLLVENGIGTVGVSNIPVLGDQVKYMNLWETVLKVTEKGNPRKRSYIVYADSPADAEAFISEWFEINVEATFELVKAGQVEYHKVIRVYDTERDEYEAGGVHAVKWYKCRIYAMVDGGSEGAGAGSINLLVSAFSLENAIGAARAVMNRNEYETIYNTFKTVQELNIVDVFAPEEKVSYYSNEEL